MSNLGELESFEKTFRLKLIELINYFEQKPGCEKYVRSLKEVFLKHFME